jgi:hypothetical protein
MLGINDPWIAAAYLLCIGSTLLCVVYGLIAWNRGDDAVRQEDVAWAEREKAAEKDEQ